MFIALEGMTASVPEDVRALDVFSARARTTPDYGEMEGGDKIGETQEVPIGGDGLDRWDVQSHQYTAKAAVEASYLVRLFSSKTQISSYGLIQEAKRYCIRNTKIGRRFELGTSVRLSVVVFSTNFDVALTLPNIAAKAQLTDLRARIALSVDGYTGPLGELLPAPDNLNVENLAVYLNAFKTIQSQVFGSSGLRYNTPTMLGYYDNLENSSD